MRRARIGPDVVLLLAAVPLLLAASHSDNLYLVPDVPADLGAATFLPWQVVRASEGVYGSVLLLPAGTAIDAVHRMDDGHWLVSVESPTMLGGIAASPSDVLDVYDFPGGYAKRFDGVARGVPAGSNVTSVFLDGGDSGDLVMSFDVPTTIGGQTFEPADLVRFDGTSFSLYFDASGVMQIPGSHKVTGADKWENITLMTFDVPVTLGALTVRPGDVVSWNGTSFALFHSDPAWPAGTVIDALALLARPGRVPPTIQIRPSAARGKLTISWEASCSAGAEDYAIYEGTIGDWYSHVPIDCSDDGADLTEDVAFSPGDRYYIVVPLNASAEGSYGVAVPSGAERPRGATTCVSSQRLGVCP